MPGRFDAQEVSWILDAIVAGAPALCPACDVELDSTAVPPRADVSYVRDRILLVCSRCHRAAVLDRPHK